MDKRISHIFLTALLFSFGIISCKHGADSSSEVLPSSSGKYGEILVVVDSSLNNGAVGQKLDEIFLQALEATPQREAMFRMSTVDPYNFKSILKRSRNLFKVSMDSKHTNKIKVDRNVWAKDQLLINVYADSEESVLRMLEKNTQTIRDYYNEEELKRLNSQFKIKPEKDLMAEIKEKYGLDILIPPAFIMMENGSDHFWLKKEKRVGEHQIIQGLLFYTFPYSSDSTFSASYMIEQRDEHTKKMIEGVRDSSYMQVYKEFKPISREINMLNRYVIEYKGLWNMKNDFMGGPFIHYTFLDKENKKVINLDGFVYAPKFNKREYLRELEAMIKSVDIKRISQQE